MKLTTKIFIGIFLGIIAGGMINTFAPNLFPTFDTYLFQPLGKLFLNLIKMLVVPIVLFSIILGTSSLGDPKKLGRIGVKTIGYFLVTTMIAIVIGLSMALLIKPGLAGEFETTDVEFEAKEAPPISETFLNMIPTNPIQALAEGNMLQIILLAIFIGMAITVLGEKANTFRKFVEEGNDIMMYLVSFIMKLAPYGAFGLIASAIGSQGWDAIQAMGLYLLVVLISLVLHAFITYGSSIFFIAKKSPLWFFKTFAPAMSVALSTSSSSATLPISMETAQRKLKVPEPISSFVQPLGATINMDGTAIMQGVATVFIAQVYGVDLSLSELVTIVLTAVLASIGTAGVPGVGLILLAMVLTSVQLPVEGIALVLGIDRLVDMARTAVNITGDAACALVVAETEKRKTIKEQRGE
ncbi:MAG: dicarboxylate/amino acid:cation symporter [Bacillus sp. (in: Bacteria)]|nr:dicarboxylate/amino acid:cation symporter [Bacillus sp. (in: firmicutes)]